jgi:BON domain-containing protein
MLLPLNEFSELWKGVKMADANQNPGRKWRVLENEGDGNRFFDSYRYTPYTTDLEFFNDPKIYETEVARTTLEGKLETDSPAKPRGVRRSDERIKEEIETLFHQHRQVDASDIEVTVKDGVATLSGKVSSPLEQRTAEEIAKIVFGVLKVNNQLRIDTQS